MLNKRSAFLLIISGWGMAAPGPANAFSFANTPNLDFMLKNFSNFELKVPSKHRLSNLNALATSTQPVDLEARILNSIDNNSLKLNPVLTDLVENIKNTNSKLHIVLRADYFGSINYKLSEYFIKYFKNSSLKREQLKFYFLVNHAEDIALLLKYIESMAEKIYSHKIGYVAGVCFVGSESLNAVVENVSEFLINAKGRVVRLLSEALEAIKRGKTTDFIISSKNNPYIVMNALDGLLDLNLDQDSFAEKLRNNINTSFSKDRGGNSKITYVNLSDLPNVHENILIKSFIPYTTITTYFSQKQLFQLLISSKIDGPEVLNALNLNSQQLSGQDVISIYEVDLIREQRKLFEKLKEKLNQDKYSLIIGYVSSIYKTALTGKIDETILAIEDLDKEIAELANTALHANYVTGIVSDVGLAEAVYNNKGEISTGSISSVVGTLVDNSIGNTRGKGDLKDFVPTLLSVCGHTKPAAMEGVNLLNI